MSRLSKILVAASLLLGGASNLAAQPVLEPTTQKFIDGLAGATPIYKLTPDQAM